MSASETYDFPRELVQELRALPTGASASLRERVRALGEPQPRRLRFPWLSSRRALFVLAPACVLAVLAAAVVHGVLSSSTTSRDAGRLSGVAENGLRAHAGVDTPRGSQHSPVYGAATTPADALGTPLRSSLLPTPSPTRHQDYEADLRVRVSDLDALGRRTAEAMRVTTELGGYVASVQQSSTAGAPGEADLLLRIPVAKVQTALIRMSALGTVLDQHVSIVDLEQTVQQQRDRIRALRLRVARITAALQQSLPADVRLRLRFQLDNTRRALTRVTGANRTTLREAALSHVALTLTTQHVIATKQHHRGRIAHAASNAVDFLAGAGAIVLLVLIVISPLLLLAGAWWYGSRAWRRREERRLLAEA
jgi:Domain of unknown function (DUF4349)